MKPMADIRVTSVIQTYEQRLNPKPYVCSTTFGRAKLGANNVSNKLFLAFLFSDPDVGAQFLKDMRLIRSSIVCCKCGSQMSWCVHTNRKDGYWWRCRRITFASACSASTSIRDCSCFQQIISRRFCSSRTTSFVHTHTIESMRWHSSVPTTGRGGLHLSTGPLHVCGGVPIRQRAPLHKFFGIVSTMAWSATLPLPRGHVAM